MDSKDKDLNFLDASLALRQSWKDPSPPFSSLTGRERSRLESTWELVRGRSESNGEAALARLRNRHETQKAADPLRVHPSWIARALQDEPSSVRNAVISTLSETIRSDLSADGQDLSKPADLQYRALASALAMSKLVGDVPDLVDDPLVIAVISRLPAAPLTRLIRRVGLVKWSLQPLPIPASEAVEFETLRPWIESLGEWPDAMLEASRLEVGRLKPNEPKLLSRLGLWTFAKLLSGLDPRRVRWALQHLPYTTAKLLRGRIATVPGEFDAVIADELRLLRASWEHLSQDRHFPKVWEPSTEAPL